MIIKPKDTEEVDIKKLKEIHDFYVCTLQILTTKQFYFEEMEAVKGLVDFYKQCRLDIFKKIEELEPKEEKTETEEVKEV